jgi:hypothetical protein
MILETARDSQPDYGFPPVFALKVGSCDGEVGVFLICIVRPA